MTTAMPYLSKAVLTEKLLTYGETVPEGWTRLQMEGRLWELHQSEEPSVRTIRQKQLKELRKACKNKGEIKTYLELHHNVELTGNETLKSMQARAYEELMKASPALREDKMEFGKHSAMEYQEVILNDPNYTDWCITTMMETGGLKGTANWRLKRYASWAQEVRKDPRGLAKLRNKSAPERIHPASSGMESASSFSLVSSEKNHTNIEKEEEMFSESETENRIQALEDQIRDLRRQGKKGKTNSEEKQ